MKKTQIRFGDGGGAGESSSRILEKSELKNFAGNGSEFF